MNKNANTKITAVNEETGERLETTVEVINTVLARINNARLLPGQPSINLTPKTFSAVLDQAAAED